MHPMRFATRDKYFNRLALTPSRGGSLHCWDLHKIEENNFILRAEYCKQNHFSILLYSWWWRVRWWAQLTGWEGGAVEFEGGPWGLAAPDGLGEAAKSESSSWSFAPLVMDGAMVIGRADSWVEREYGRWRMSFSPLSISNRVIGCLLPVIVNRHTPIRVRAGTKNSRPVGFYCRNSTGIPSNTDPPPPHKQHRCHLPTLWHWSKESPQSDAWCVGGHLQGLAEDVVAGFCLIQ